MGSEIQREGQERANNTSRLVAVETLQGHPAVQVLPFIFSRCFHHRFSCCSTSCCVVNSRHCHLLGKLLFWGGAGCRKCQRDARGMLLVTSPRNEHLPDGPWTHVGCWTSYPCEAQAVVVNDGSYQRPRGVGTIRGLTALVLWYKLGFNEPELVPLRLMWPHRGSWATWPSAQLDSRLIQMSIQKVSSISLLTPQQLMQWANPIMRSLNFKVFYT